MTDGVNKAQAVSLIQGVSVENISGVNREYKCCADAIELTLSAQDYKMFFARAVELLEEPVFFFLEIPEDGKENYETYYLDNCTVPVAKAILERYSGILFCDGVIRFGFGSHKTDAEIYMQELQLVRIYSKRHNEFISLLEELGYRKNDKTVSIYELISDTNECVTASVESDGECFKDIIENLSELGMYKADS